MMRQDKYWAAHMAEMYQGEDFLGHPQAKEVFLALRARKHEVLSPTTARLVRSTTAGAKNNVIEIGPGWGFDATLLAATGLKYHAVDLTPENIEHTRAALTLTGASDFELKVGDACALPFADGMFDCVYSNGVLHHTNDTQKAISEAARVCRQGGRIGLMLYNNWLGTKVARLTQPRDPDCIVNRYTPREVAAMLGNARIVESWVETPADTWYGRLLNKLPERWLAGSFLFVVACKE